MVNSWSSDGSSHGVGQVLQVGTHLTAITLPIRCWAGKGRPSSYSYRGPNLAATAVGWRLKEAQPCLWNPKCSAKRVEKHLPKLSDWLPSLPTLYRSSPSEEGVMRASRKGAVMALGSVKLTYSDNQGLLEFPAR